MANHFYVDGKFYEINYSPAVSVYTGTSWTMELEDITVEMCYCKKCIKNAIKNDRTR